MVNYIRKKINKSRDKFMLNKLHETCDIQRFNRVIRLIGEYNLQKKYFMIPDKNGITLLSKAIVSGSFELTKILIEYCKDNLMKEDIMKFNTYYQSTVFERAIYYGYLKIVNLLIEKYNLQKEDIKIIHSNGNNALYKSIYFGDIEIAKLLCIKGNVTREDILMECDDYGRTIMYRATLLNCIDSTLLNCIDLIQLLCDIGNLTKKDIMKQMYVGVSLYDIAVEPIRQIFKKIIFKEDINGILDDIIISF